MKPLKYKRGEIYLADLDPVIGSEQGGIRPVLIIQNNTGNRFSPTVIVASITSKRREGLPTHVQLGGRFGLPRHSLLTAEQTKTIDKSRLKERIAQVDRNTMLQIDHALKISMGLLQNEPTLVTLCPSCASEFFHSASYFIKRVDPYQSDKAACSFCNSRYGYDYWITDNKRKRRPSNGQED